jgi:hypothetical protein
MMKMNIFLFIQALKDNKAAYANAFKLTNYEYDELAKKAAALALYRNKWWR